MPRSTTVALRGSVPAAPRERAALLLGGAAVVMGSLMLLLAIAAVLWTMGLYTSSASYGHFGGLSFVAWARVLPVVVPGVVVLCTLAVLYLRAGLRARDEGVRTPGLWLTGPTSLGLAVVIAVLALAIEAGQIWRGLDSLFSAWREFAVVSFTVVAVHGVVTSVLARPGGQRRVAAWLLAGAVAVAVGATLVVRGGADRWLDGPPLPGLAASVTGFGGTPDALALSRDATRLAAADGSRITFFDVPGDRELWTTHLRAFARPGHEPPSLAVSPDGAKLLYIADEGFAVLDTARGELMLTPTCGPGKAPSGLPPVHSGTFARDGAVLALSGASLTDRKDGQLCIIDATSGLVRATVARACTSLTATATAENDRVWGVCDGRPTAFDLETSAELQVIDTVAHALALSPDGSRLITILSLHADPRWIRIHDADSGALVQEFTIAEPTNAIVGSLRGGEAWLIAGSGLLFEVDLAARRVVRTHCHDLRAAASAADRLVTSSDACHPAGESLWVRDASR